MSLPSFKQGDTLPALVVTLLSVDGVTPQSLPGGTVVRFTMRSSDGVIRVNRQLCTILGSPGRVSYAWAAGNLDGAGVADCEFEATFTDGTVLTFPTNGSFRIMVEPQIA
jgi:hypothetical protein